MTHYNTFTELLAECESNPDMEGTIRSTFQAGRLVAGQLESQIRAAAFMAGVDLTLNRLRGGLLEVTFTFEVDGKASDIANFARHLMRLERKFG